MTSRQRPWSTTCWLPSSTFIPLESCIETWSPQTFLLLRSAPLKSATLDSLGTIESLRKRTLYWEHCLQYALQDGTGHLRFASRKNTTIISVTCGHLGALLQKFFTKAKPPLSTRIKRCYSKDLQVMLSPHLCKMVILKTQAMSAKMTKSLKYSRYSETSNHSQTTSLSQKKCISSTNLLKIGLTSKNQEPWRMFTQESIGNILKFLKNVSHWILKIDALPKNCWITNYLTTFVASTRNW